MGLLIWTFKSTPDTENGESIVSQGKRVSNNVEVGAKLWRTVVCEGAIIWMEQKGICYNSYFTELNLEII